MTDERKNALFDYAQNLLILHRMISEGKGDSQEADDIRDKMDRPWLSLNAADVAAMNVFSASIYALFEDGHGKPRE